MNFIFNLDDERKLFVYVCKLLQPHLVNSLIVVDISPVRTSPAIIDLTTMFDAMLSVKFEPNIPLSRARQIVDQQLMKIVPVRYIQLFCTNVYCFIGFLFEFFTNWLRRKKIGSCAQGSREFSAVSLNFSKSYCLYVEEGLKIFQVLQTFTQT